MHTRIKMLRNNLRLNQKQFGKRLGVSNTAISKLEKGERNLTEQMALAICREFHVNYFWLVEGAGDMLAGTPKDAVDELAGDYQLDEIDKKLIQRYLELDQYQRKTIKNYFSSIFT